MQENKINVQKAPKSSRNILLSISFFLVFALFVSVSPDKIEDLGEKRIMEEERLVRNRRHSFLMGKKTTNNSSEEFKAIVNKVSISNKYENSIVVAKNEVIYKQHELKGVIENSANVDYKKSKLKEVGVILNN